MTGERRMLGIGGLNFCSVPARKQEQLALLRFILEMSDDHVSE
jgi:hypothetical protein